MIILISTIFISGCTTGSVTYEKTDKEPIKLTITIWPGFAYAFVAQEKDFLRRIMLTWS